MTAKFSRPTAALALAILVTPLAALDVAAPAQAQGATPPQSDYDPFRLCTGTPLLPAGPAVDPSMRDQSPVDIDAATFDISDREVYLLEGDVTLTRADQILAADRLRYTHSASSYRAEGDVRYRDSGVAITATSAEGNISTDQTRLADVRYQLVALRGNGQAQSAALEGPRGEFKGVDYSTCDRPDPSWVLRSEQLNIDRETGIAKVRNATLRIGDVPVFWLPYASFPIDDRRRSGFLYPSIGSNGNTGVDLRAPYYLNIAPNMDATLIARVLGRRGIMLGAEYRYLFDRHAGQIEGDWLPEDDLTGDDRGSARLQHRSQFNDVWGLYADINHVSDDRYFEDFGDSLSATSTRLLPSQVTLAGRGTFWRAAVAAERWDITDPLVPDSAEPYRRLPRATYRWRQPVLEWLELSLAAEAVAFSHSDRADATRYDLMPAITVPLERSWGYLRPQMAWRETGYSLDREFTTLGFNDRSPSRGVPIGSLDAGLLFERDTAFFGSRFLQTLEPRLYYLNVPREAQDDLPIFDTQELTFSFAQLFRPNRFSGADRQGDANQATLALTSRLYESDSGRERLSASIGQIRYFEAQQVQLPGQPPLDVSGSAYVGDLQLSLSDRWGVGITQQWDPNIDATLVSGIRALWRGQRGALANIAYRYRRDVLEQTDASFVIPLTPQWKAIGRWNYSLRDESTLEALAGAEWENCCIAARLLGRHYVRNREGEKNNAIYFELELKGLASLGRDSGKFLQQAIVGYDR